MTKTRIQFEVGAEAADPAGESVGLRAMACPSCAQTFSGDARFCPFDGEALQDAPNWDPFGDPLLGTVIDGRYEVQSMLGEGGMGTVYRACHVKLGRRLALKVLRRGLSQDRELATRFIQEAKAAAAITHPNVVQITDFGELPGGQPYFVMELLRGHSLSGLIAAGGIEPSRTLSIVRQVVQALEAAHAAGIIHRDLKPDNVHVSSAPGDRELVKVLDFGLAQVVGSSRMTREGVVFGTPHYMSPEQAAGEPIDFRSDIYALGVLLYEMLTGQVPFEADSYMGVLTKHLYLAPARPSKVAPPDRRLGELEDLTLCCLEKKPQDRFASMSDLRERLDALAQGQLAGSQPATESRRWRQLRQLRRAGIPVGRRGWTLMTGGVAGAILVAGGIAWGLGAVGGKSVQQGNDPRGVQPAPPTTLASASASPSTSASTPRSGERVANDSERRAFRTADAGRTERTEPTAPAERQSQQTPSPRPATGPERPPNRERRGRLERSKPKSNGPDGSDIVDPWAQ